MRRLRIALRAYPRRVRDAERDVLLGLAQDLVDAGASVNREAAGLVRGGLVARAGALAHAPWDEALGRLAVPLAVGFTAFAWGLGARVLASSGAAWPGWGWVVTLLAPLLALGGLLAGRRVPAALGALALVLLGVLNGNSLPATTHGWFSAHLEWDVGGGATNGYSLAALGCAIPGALVLLAAAARLPHMDRPRRWSAALAWAAAGSLGVLLVGTRRVSVEGVHLDGAGVLLAAYGAAVLGYAAVVTAGPGRRDPASLLASLLALATTVPAAGLLAISALPVPDVTLPVLLGLAVLAASGAFMRAAAVIARR